MAECTKGRLLDFLKDLKIDLTQFKDLSFDNICEEKDLQPFLCWLVSSFDSSNVRRSSVYLESENNYKCDILNEVVKIEQKKLELNQSHLNLLRLEEEELIKQEKLAIEKYNQTLKALIDDEVLIRNDLVEKEVENTLKIIQNAKPYLPDLDAMREDDKRIFENNEKFYQEDIVELEEELAREEEDGVVEQGYEQVLEEMENKVQSSISNFKKVVREVTGVEQQEEKYPSAQEIARGRLRNREMTRLRRRLDLMGKLENSYDRYSEAAEKSLVLTEQCFFFVGCVHQTAQSVSDLIDEFVADVKKEGDIAEKLVAECENQSDEVDGSPVSVPDESTNQCVEVYTGLLEQLRQEYQSNTESWEDLDRLVQHFRNGPNLRFCLVPTELMLLVIDARKMHQNLYARLKKLAAEFAETKKERHSDRPEKGMWVYFLADPHKLAIKYNESFNITNI